MRKQKRRGRIGRCHAPGRRVCFLDRDSPAGGLSRKHYVCQDRGVQILPAGLEAHPHLEIVQQRRNIGDRARNAKHDRVVHPLCGDGVPEIVDKRAGHAIRLFPGGLARLELQCIGEQYREHRDRRGPFPAPRPCRRTPRQGQAESHRGQVQGPWTHGTDQHEGRNNHPRHSRPCRKREEAAPQRPKQTGQHGQCGHHAPRMLPDEFPQRQMERKHQITHGQVGDRKNMPGRDIEREQRILRGHARQPQRHESRRDEEHRQCANDRCSQTGTRRRRVRFEQGQPEPDTRQGIRHFLGGERQYSGQYAQQQQPAAPFRHEHAEQRYRSEVKKRTQKLHAARYPPDRGLVRGMHREQQGGPEGQCAGPVRQGHPHQCKDQQRVSKMQQQVGEAMTRRRPAPQRGVASMGKQRQRPVVRRGAGLARKPVAQPGFPERGANGLPAPRDQRNVVAQKRDPENAMSQEYRGAHCRHQDHDGHAGTFHGSGQGHQRSSAGAAARTGSRRGIA